MIHFGKKTFYMCSVFLISLVGNACNSTEQKSKVAELTMKTVHESDSVYLRMGRQVITAAFSTLSSRLQQAMQRGGVREAVTYCNMTALPLTDSLSEINSVGIKRTSLKWRNPSNAPTSDEAEVLAMYETEASAKKQLKPIVRRHTNQFFFYAPITIHDLCLKCHGQVGRDVLEEDYALIRRLYPEDRAIAYEGGQFRGIWSVSFDNAGKN